MEDSIKSTMRMLADDCIIYMEIRNHNDQVTLNHELAQVANWCQAWQMKISLDKTVFMRVSRKKRPTIIHQHDLTAKIKNSR